MQSVDLTQLKCRARAIGLAMLAFFFMVAPMVDAQVMGTYENSGIYNGPKGQIVATNFVNDSGGIFNIDLPSLTGQSLAIELFDGWNSVQNYTNNGNMNCNVGFRFDDQTQAGGRIGALNFDNAGVISNGVGFADAVAMLQYYDIDAVSIFAYGGIDVFATNIVNSGSILSGYSSFMNFQGNNIDLTDGTLGMTTNIFTGILGLGTPAYGLFGGFGLNTNLWYPFIELNLTSATTSLPFGLVINNSTPYINTVTNYQGSNTLVQAVFILNQLPNSTATVAFSVANFTNAIFNNFNFFNTIYIQWAGSTFDPFSGLQGNNYLLLTDESDFAISTNVGFAFNNVPDNFSFQSQLGVPFFSASAVSGFPAGFAFLPAAGITNRYSDVVALLQPSTAGTNLIPGGALTNIAGRVELSAANTLNISGASISGLNYLSMRATNQFLNDGQAYIAAPYSDLYLGSTNGNLVLTNVLVSSVPGWNGTISAWSSGWNTTNAGGGTNFYEVLVVKAAVNPVFLAQQQDVMLYASNNLVVSDTMGIMRNFFTTATNLLLTTNEVGVGAYALDGELNIQPPEFSWAAATPNLSILTNNGAIRTANYATFGSAIFPYISFANNGVISNANGATIFTGDFENSGNFSAGSGSFTLNADTAYLTNGAISAGASVSLTANTLLLSNLNLTIGKGLTFAATNVLSDTGPTNGNTWSIGANYVGSGLVPGFSDLSKPTTGDLLGTTVLEYSPGAILKNTWAGVDYGLSNLGYTNNEAIGRLILDSTTNGTHFGRYNIVGAGTSNAIYIDYLEFRDAATNGVNNNYEFTPWFNISANIVVYYAQAVAEGVSIAEKLNNATLAGKNGGRLRWVPSYAGYFSSTNVIRPDGTTNVVNAALKNSTQIDSNGNGIVNANDPSPFYTVTDVDFNVQVTNKPPLTALITWHSIPGSTNVVSYSTSLGSTNWVVLTNFVSPAIVPPVGGWPITNLVVDPVNLSQPHFYRVGVTPNNQLEY